MLLGVFDYEQKFPTEISDSYNMIFLDTNLKGDLPDIDRLFIDLLPKSNIDGYARQAEIILHYVKKNVRTFIFDRYLSLEKKEYNWLKKHNVRFFEPAVRGRFGFGYLPQWIEIPTEYYCNFETEKRNIDLAYSGELSDKFISFEKYYVKYANLYSDRKVIYDDFDCIKNNEYKQTDVKLQKFDWKDVRRTIVIDKPQNYQRGYLNESFLDAMKNGCLPLLAKEHKYFHLMFEGLVISNFDSLRWSMSKGIDIISNTLLSEIFERIERYYPEFTSSYASNIIRQELKL